VSLRVLIVDDEPPTRRALRRHLAAHADIEVIGECGDGASAVAAIRSHHPDLLFLDIAMPEVSGLDVVREIGVESMPATVFVTAYDQYALQAFDAEAVDYLLKPFTKERFARALIRARERIAGRLNVDDMRRALAAIARVEAPKYAQRFTVESGGRLVLVNVDEIVWIRSNGNYARIRAGSCTYSLRETLARLETQLDPRYFARIHRSTIINVRRIREIQPWFRGHHVVILDTGEHLRMSRYQREAAKTLGL
jgi:two-component system, LytTR family, response regulator